MYLKSSGRFFANSAVLARIVHTHVNLPLAESTGVAGVAATRKVVDSVDTNTLATQVGRAVIPVDLAARAGESRRAVARERVEGVAAFSAVQARRARTVVDIVLAVGAAEAVDAGAVVAVDAVGAVSVVPAGVGAALVVVNFAVLTLES